MKHCFWISLLFAAGLLKAADSEHVTIRFAAQVNGKPFACGTSYQGIGTTKSTITPRDFRLYIQSARLIDEQGQEVPLVLAEDNKWQGAGTTLLDFEDGTGPCANGTPDMNDSIVGDVPAGHKWRGVRFTVGVPFEVNHQELTSLPSPLNLTALNWVWNAGHKFMRIDFTSTGQTRGFFVHLGSTGCTRIRRRQRYLHLVRSPIALKWISHPLTPLTIS